MKHNKKRSPLDIRKGGRAINIDNNTYLMKGKTHKQGGIKIGPPNNKGLEVENNEIIRLENGGIAKVYSAQPILNGDSPANKILKGEDPNIVFNKQEVYKDRLGLNDDGTKAKLGTIININGNIKNKTIYRPVEGRSKAKLGKIDRVGKLLNPPTYDVTRYNSDYKLLSNNISPINSNNVNSQSIYSRTVPKLGTKDYIGAGANILGAISDYASTNRAIYNQRGPARPISVNARKFKTKYNANPQLSELDEYRDTINRNIDSNTSSSRTALARKQKVINETSRRRNEILGEKENIEIGLLNRDIENQQNISSRNIDRYNEYRDKVNTFKNNKLLAKADNRGSLINNVNAVMQDSISRLEQRRRFNNTTAAMQAGYSYVDPRIFDDVYDTVNTKNKYGRRIGNFK